MNVFCDYHHGDLYYSLHALFEKRLGYNLYRPIGLDWFSHGYWKIAEPYGNAQDTINQYLSVDDGAWDPYKRLNGGNYIEDDIYYVFEPVHKYYQKAITLQKFKDMRFDLIVSSYQRHDVPFSQLQQKFQPHAKLIAQLGNTGQKTHLQNVLASVPYIPLHGQNVVHYHQELDLDIYKFIPPDTSQKKIFNVANLFPYPNIYNRVREALPDVEMRSYGAGCPDGPLYGAEGVARKMSEANLGWHLKPQGGLGHSAMGWYASGRPVITNMSQHQSWGGDALKLFVPGETCINSEVNFNDLIATIRRWLEPEENLKRAHIAYQRFKEIFNYDKEEKQIRQFLERLL